MAPVIHLTDSLWLPSWIFIISLSLSLSSVWMFQRSQKAGLLASSAMDLALVIAVGGFVGARIVHIFYEQPSYYLAHPWDIFSFWQGGFIFYGGMISGGFTAWWFCRWRKLDFWRWADLFAPVVALNYAVGRVGCFLNGCCYGRACSLPWAVTFHSHAPLGIEVIPRHPTQLYATVWESITLIFLLWLERRQPRTSGQIFLIWLVLHGVGRLIMEAFRDDDRGAFIGPLSLSSCASIVLIIFALIQMRKLERVSM